MVQYIPSLLFIFVNQFPFNFLLKVFDQYLFFFSAAFDFWTSCFFSTCPLWSLLCLAKASKNLSNMINRCLSRTDDRVDMAASRNASLCSESNDCLHFSRSSCSDKRNIKIWNDPTTKNGKIENDTFKTIKLKAQRAKKLISWQFDSTQYI